MKNLVREGSTITITGPSGGLTSGQAYLAGTILVVALTAIAEGATGDAAAEGVFALPKDSGAITQGALVYWNATNSNLTTTASGNTLVGVCWTAAASGDATVDLKLKGR